MAYIVCETLIPRTMTGAESKSFKCPGKDSALDLVRKIRDKAIKKYGIKKSEIGNPDSLLWKECEGYLEAYLDKTQPYSEWSVTWKEEENPEFNEDVDDFFDYEE